MAKIQRLDPHLTNMIAAGEVVERPVGVIKELVENAIDAQAESIEIHTLQGGIEEMMVIDDGKGMSKEDALLAFERHATSKIKDIQDLWKIATMGFRGEALPSIASVSNVQLLTNNGEESTEVEIAYGETIKHGSVGTPLGTQITVRNLFQKTPARFKHLKAPSYEFSLVSDVVQKFALAYPNISFSLSNDHKRVFTSNGNGQMQEILMNIYGREVVRDAIAIHQGDSDYTLQGFALQPNFNRATKYYMLIYVNRRMIRSFRLQKAIIDAYSRYIPNGRYPIVVLNIEMDPQLVDVNVHPSKWEIRLSKEKQLEQLIYTVLENALQQGLQTSKMIREPQEKIETPRFEFTYKQPEEINVKEMHQSVNESFLPFQEKEDHVAEIETPMVDDIITEIPKEEVAEEFEVIKEAPKAMNPSLPQMSVIGQLHKCYILVQGDHGLYIVDQHAAQERYHYEQIQNALLKGQKDNQDLLIPLSLEVPLQAIQQMDDINSLLNQIGIHLESFGSTTIIVRSLPLWVSKVEEEKFIQDMIDMYLKNDEIDLAKLRKYALASMACHSSIRFNRSLNFAEMEQVIEDLRKCEQPFHCPHGRPTFIEITLKELEKDFLRVK